MTNTHQIAQQYRSFADQQAAGVSATFEAWARAVAEDSGLLGLIAELPIGKQQPNLVFAAARLHGAEPGDHASLRATLTSGWPRVRATILGRSTQTNEASRCAALLLGLQQIQGPVALVEVGAAAGICLVPEQYSYTFSDGSRLDPWGEPSLLTIPIMVVGGLQPPTRMPEIVWRAGLDLNPLDPANPSDLAWLSALVWPEHAERRRRLSLAAAIAEAAHLDVRRGNLLHDLGALVSEAPRSATLVVSHSATLAYLSELDRRDAVAGIARLGARRLSLEGRGVDPSVRGLGAPVTADTLFVAALDGRPYALSDGHGSRLSAIVE